MNTVMSKKNVFGGLAAGVLFLAIIIAGCDGNTPVNPDEGGPSRVTLANLADSMVRVEGGTYTRGCRESDNEMVAGAVADTNATCINPTLPVATATVAEFFICKYEVTQGLWKEVMGASDNPSVYKGNDLPVTNVTGNILRTFFTNLNEKTKSGRYTYRLPSEAEWEYAARGGASGVKAEDGSLLGKKYSGSDEAASVAVYGGETNQSISGPAAVGTKSPNELGLYDMSGNVWEIVLTTDNQSGQFRVERGGSWFGREVYCGVTYRKYIGNIGVSTDQITKPTSDRGFRIAATLK